MIKSTIVEKNEDGINRLIESVSNFCEGTFLQAMHESELSNEEIIYLTDVLRTFRSTLDIEFHSLQGFEKEFLNNYSTDNNECYDTAARLFIKLRRTISKTKMLLAKFTPTDRRCATDLVPYSSVVTRSGLIQTAYTADMFDISQYRESVQNLYKEVSEFIKLLKQCLLLCRKVFNDERFTRHSYVRSKRAYDYTYKKIINKASGFAEFLKPQVLTLKTDEFTRRKAEAKSLETFICSNYHKYPLDQFRRHALIDYFAKGSDVGLTPLETALWGDDVQSVLDVRLIIDNLDSIRPSRRKKVGALVIVALATKYPMRNMKIFVEQYLPARYHGKSGLVTYHAVSTAKCNFAKGDNVSEVQDIMEAMGQLLRSERPGTRAFELPKAQ